MALSVEKKAQLARMTLPSELEMQKRIRSFLLRSGLSRGEFSEMVGYSPVSISHFLNGTYDAHHPNESNSAAIRAACKEFLDLNEITHDIRLRGDHFPTADYKAIRHSALSALQKGTAYIVDGPPGTQKSWSFLNIQREIQERQLGRAVYIYARVNHSPQSFLIECCTAAGIPNRGSIDMLLRKLQFFLGAGRTLLLVDEAQHLDLRGLEVLRQLLDLPPYFGVMLGGSHDLTQRLQHWQMEQWRRRVRKTHFLTGPSREEARAILAQRAGMSRADADATIADCMATATRTERCKGKDVAKQYEYISAGLLFGLIEGLNDSSTTELEASA